MGASKERVERLKVAALKRRSFESEEAFDAWAYSVSFDLGAVPS